MARPDPGGFYRSLFDLEGKVAVVIGGTGVLCGEMARGLLGAGARVVLIGRNQEKADRHFRRWQSTPAEARFLKADAVLREEVEGIVPTVTDWFGRIDIWINGTAAAPPIPYLEITDEQYAALLDVNLKAVHLGCQVIGREWIAHNQPGCIINMSSMAAVRPLSRSFVYSLAKAALLNLTQNLAREWAENHIRVNALCPGFFPAEQNRALLDPERIAAIQRQTPMKRFGEPGELVAATLLLSSDKAGSFITGANLVVDGGFSVMAI